MSIPPPQMQMNTPQAFAPVQQVHVMARGASTRADRNTVMWDGDGWSECSICYKGTWQRIKITMANVKIETNTTQCFGCHVDTTAVNCDSSNLSQINVSKVKAPPCPLILPVP
eukprot:765844-Hanusia_phi.AAC.1